MTPIPNLAFPYPIGPPDQEVLQAIAEFLRDSPLIAHTEFNPDPYEPQLLRAKLDGSATIPETHTAELEIQWFVMDYFSIRYIETQEDGERQWCQWDKHPNSSSEKIHFHDFHGGEQGEAISLKSHNPLDVVLRVLTVIGHYIKDSTVN